MLLAWILIALAALAPLLAIAVAMLFRVFTRYFDFY